MKLRQRIELEAKGTIGYSEAENKESFMVGDRWRDVEAGRRAGCVTVLIDNQYAEKEGSQPDVRVSSLFEAADWILNYNKLGD